MYNVCVISPHLLFQKLRRLFQRDAGARRAAKAAGEPAAGRRPFCGAAILRSGIRQPFQVSQPQERGVAPQAKRTSAELVQWTCSIRSVPESFYLA